MAERQQGRDVRNRLRTQVDSDKVMQGLTVINGTFQCLVSCNSDINKLADIACKGADQAGVAGSDRRFH